MGIAIANRRNCCDFGALRSLTLQSLLFFARKARMPPKKARISLSAEPLKSLEKKGKTHKKSKENRETKRQGERRKQGRMGAKGGKPRKIPHSTFLEAKGGSKKVLFLPFISKRKETFLEPLFASKKMLRGTFRGSTPLAHIFRTVPNGGFRCR